MKALVLTGRHEVSVMDFPGPPMGDNDVKVEVAYCGLCGSDLHKYEGRSGSRPLKLPVPLGHEISGVVAEVGANVRDFKPGDRVTVDPNWACGGCYFCKKDLRHMCLNSRGVVKGMADYICPPQENVYKIPDTLSLRDAALTEPLACCLHGMDLLDIKLGETVAIVGLGAIGTIMLQLCKLASATEVVVIDTEESKRALAEQLGATLFVNPITQDVCQVVADHGIVNVDKVMECVGNNPAIDTALRVAGKGARVVLFGLGDPAKPYPFNQYEAITKELEIRTSFLNAYMTQRAIDLLDKGAINCDLTIAKVVTPEEMVEELHTRKYSAKGKVMAMWKEFENDGIVR